MNNLTKEVIKINLEEELKNSYLDYAMSVIIGRALPDVRDGLKPVHRRVLFAMYMLNNEHNKPYKKSARIVGDVIGKYHPHGDTSVYEAIVRMAQSFSLRYMLIDGQGNFGSIDGDSAAAMRYTEVRMSKIAKELLSDLEKNTVKFVFNYDETEKMPEVLPTRIPNILINGASGIAVGMATNIPPHNLKEIINGCIAFIEDNSISVDKLMEHIPGPDFPTAGIINGKEGIISAYKTGKGKIYIRSRHKIESNSKNKKTIIVIQEIPYQVNKSRLIEKIAELIRDKKIDGISALRDESDKEGMRIIIEIKKESVPEVVLNNLYSLTQLQISFGINMVALNKGRPEIMSLKKIIKSFIDHRKEIITKRSIFELLKFKNKAHALEGIMIAINNIDYIIKLIQKTKEVKEVKKIILSKGWKINNCIIKKIQNNQLELFENNKQVKNIIKDKYYFSKKQTENILDLKINKITKIEQQNIIKEYDSLVKKIKELKLILKNPIKMINIIKQELTDIQKTFGDKRKTEINKNIIDINIEDMINKEDVVVTLSHSGYVKYQPISDYEAQRRGGKGKSAARIKEEDFIDKLIVTNTHDTILCFSSKGIIYWMKVYQLPESSRIARGKPIVNLLPLNSKERITAILPINKYKDNINILMATSHGIVKKTSLHQFSRPRSAGIIALNLREDDELIGVALTNGNDHIMLFTSLGKVVRFHENKVRNMGRNASGMRGIKISKNDRVVSLIVPRDNRNILTITKRGYGKRTKIEEYPIKSRSTQGVISIKITKKNGKMVGAIQVFEKDQIMIITDAGTLVRIRVSEVGVLKRNTQGVILIRTTDKENVVALQRVAESCLTKLNIINKAQILL